MAVKDEMPSRDWDAYYRDYQVRLATDHLLPTLKTWGVELQGRRLLEVGCGDGGCGSVFHHAGCHVVMMDIDERLVETARRQNAREGIDVPVYAGDVYDETAPVYEGSPYDVVVFRDVIEHLEDPVRALRIVGRHLSPGGVIFAVFPPYYSPYGAHQQILPRRAIAGIPFNKLPYLQLLPDSVFRWVVRGDGGQNDEVLRLRGIRLTLGRFERAVRDAGFRIREERHYLSRPSFSLRYGLPVIEARWLGRVPGLRELIVTAGYYLLEPASR